MVDREPGTHDGSGAGDNNKDYKFGNLPRGNATHPNLSEKDRIRLEIMRGRMEKGDLRLSEHEVSYKGRGQR